ncbi:mitochondrial glycoprotein [Mycena capillaripes]|nr:mitochondrial glycoprotein [Mycena capillaripes]
MSALRTVRQLATASLRLRLPTPAARLSLLAARPTVTRAFSASARSLKATPATTQLAQKLKEELEYEKHASKESGGDQLPEFLGKFIEAGVWDIQDTPGNDEVFLTRTFGDEKIRVMFSIADLQSLGDEEEGSDDEPSEPPVTELRVSLSIGKTTHSGALNADLYCANGVFQIANWAFYSSARIGQELSIESDFARRTRALHRTFGALSSFETLDIALQEHFENFLHERGIDEELAAFVPEYAQWKEQREYLEWLKGVGSFIGA